MSSILKALKKAEESKTGALTEPTSETYTYSEKSTKLWRLVLLILSGTGVLFFIVIYSLYSKVPDKPTQITQNNKIVKNAQTVVPTSLPNNPPIPPLEKGGKMGFEDAGSLNKEAIKEIKQKNFSKAETLLKKAISIKPDNAEFYNNLGFALKARSRYKEAILQYEKALSLKPDFPEALNNLALTTELTGNKQKALKLYTKAISLRPAYAEAHLNIGLLLESMGKYGDAESHFHTFITLSNDAELKKKVKEKIYSLRR